MVLLNVQVLEEDRRLALFVYFMMTVVVHCVCHLYLICESFIFANFVATYCRNMAYLYNDMCVYEMVACTILFTILEIFPTWLVSK